VTRKHRLVDCNPSWNEGDGFIRFDCPEGHADCFHVIPFTPSLDGSAHTRNSAMWQRTGDTFETLTLSPSILRRQRYTSRDAALADGVKPEHFEEQLICGLHIFIKNGAIEFCGDSK
jgi:hypothetical protein